MENSLKKSFNYLFMKLFRSFNSHDVSVVPSTREQERRYYKYELVGPRGMSLYSENFLRSNLLQKSFEKSPEEILKQIETFYEVSKDPVYFLIAADVCHYYAGKKPEKERIQYDLGAMYNACRALNLRRKNRSEEDKLEDNTLSLQLIQIYNEATAGIFRCLKMRGMLDGDTFTLNGACGNEFIFGKPEFDLSVPRSAVEDFSLCSSFCIRSLRLINRHSGLGVPLVAAVAPTPLSRSLRTPPGLTIPVTLYFRIQKVAKKKFMLFPHYQNTTLRESVVLTDEEEGRRVSWSLTRDYTTPLACFMNKLTQRNLLAGMLNPLKFDEQAGLFMIEPYRPDRIPVVFVHGLMSSPETWGQMINSLKFNPAIRKKYQFLFFSYSTGVPALYSAKKLRLSLLAAQQEFCTTPEAAANFSKMVLVGHSMGGLLSRLLMLEDPYRALEKFIGRPWEEAQKELAPEDVEIFQNFWAREPLPFVGRVVFMAVPHLGSAMAQRQIAKLGIRLIKMPMALMKQKAALMRIWKAFFPNTEMAARKDSFITGIDNLNPKGAFVQWAGDAPLKSGVPYHSIIGNRKAAGVPGGSDGIVPYRSSHLNGVESECIVKSDHSVHRNPEAIRELLRILLLHLQENE